jgi:peptidoglycan LD-endopeptidase CwlK
MFKLSQKSLSRLEGVHPDLMRVVNDAISTSKVDFAVTEGLRTIERQRELVAKGASKTMNSRHITGHAVDLAPIIDGQIRWDWPPFYDIAAAMKESADRLGVKIVWGGDWISFKDGPHFELARSQYP